MTNKYTGEVALEIGGERLTLLYSWAALARIRSELGADILDTVLAGTDPEKLAQLVAIGLAEKHPDWSADRVMKAGAPVIPTISAVEKALNAAYWGPNGPPKEVGEENPPPRPVTPLKRLWLRLTGRA